MSTLIGIAAAVASGTCDGSYGAVMKLTKKWEWENIWILFSVIALVILPWIFAAWSVPELFGVYRKVAWTVLLRIFLFGAGWGLGSVFFGLGLYMLGMSLGYTVMMGIIAVTGSLVPMLVTNPDSVMTIGGLVIISAMLVTIGGVTVCGFAGMIRDRSIQKNKVEQQIRYSSFKAGFLVCLLAGIFSAMFNLAFHFGMPIAQVTSAYLGDAGTVFKNNSPIWSLALLGGFIPNFFYCGYLLVRTGSWQKYGQPGTYLYWLWGIFMGGIFISGAMFYGAGASNLGKLGTTVGWLVFIATGILIANLWGVITGEWKFAPSIARLRMVQGSLLLALSIILVGLGNYLLE